ncbi:hypothetical protein HG263_07490 [Pseudoalteromonas sp. JBTF-M23]|uniref:Uncharacterized protein n=1 Tax=Pseudoalteromonas caenipelagi TaxID=2726988 RepID=A0A849VEM2_9GAMM|nr:hypothetical protein [Pseudoalteromonas caenipelagi]NOU50384.1 hypothetical protein [Pseudoalteromonas caenipelagi]
MTQQTMKHGDWAKVVEIRQKKKQAKLKKSDDNKSIIAILLLGFFVIATLWVCFLDSSQQTLISTLNKAQKERITRHFSKQFIMGSWEFYDAKFTSSDINVLIKIPTELAMDELQISKYIKNSLCPSTNSQVWRDVRKYNLYISLFVDSPRKGIYAKCVNPNMA